MKYLYSLSILMLSLFQLTAQIQFNEIRIDQPSTDTDEFIELSGPAGMSLAGCTLIVIGDGTGGSGVIESAVDLSAYSIPADGFFLIAESTFTQTASVDLTTTIDLENSDNLTFLLVQDFTGSDGDDLDTDNDGVLDVTPWTTVKDGVAMIEASTPPTGTEYEYATGLGFPTVGPNGTSVPFHIFKENDTGAWTIGGDDLGTNDTPGITNVDIPLPVSLISFDAKVSQSMVVLSWETANEVNTKQFIVEHSNDSKNFNPIFTTEASGNELNGRAYAFNHDDVETGNQYYRLCMLDFDGQMVFSDVKVVSLDKVNTIRVYPTVVKNDLQLEWNSSSKNNVFQLFSINGQLMLEEKLSAEVNQHTMQMADLPNGQYILRSQLGSSFQTTRIVKH